MTITNGWGIFLPDELTFSFGIRSGSLEGD
jgi:hypothetical protein